MSAQDAAAAPRRLWGNPVLGLLWRVVLAGILAYAGIAKLLEPNGAREAIVAYRIPGMTGDIAGALGWALPVGEVVLAALLLAGLFTRWAALATGLLMAAFVIGIASVWARGYSIDCGCFGGGGDISESGKTWRYLSEILRDLLFAGMAAWLVAWPRTRLSLDRSPGSAPTHDHDTHDHDTHDHDLHDHDKHDHDKHDHDAMEAAR